MIASPVLPLITDSIASLEAVALAAKRAGADQFGAHVLFLKPSAQRVFFPFVAEKFPQHFGRYSRSYASGAYLKSRYPEFIRERVDGIRSRTGILNRDFTSIGFAPTGSQLVLF